MTRQAWVALLCFDLIVIALTPVAPYALLGLAGFACLLWLWRKPEYALAFFALGSPILDPLTLAAHDQRPVFLIVRIAVLVPLALALWNWMWRAPGVLPFGRLRQPAVGFALLFGLLLTVGTWNSPAPLYGAMKTSFYWHTNFALLISAVLLLGRASERRTMDGHANSGREAGVEFLRGVLWLQFALAVGGIWNYATHFYPWNTRLVAFGMNPIWVARHANLGLLVLLALWSLRRIRVSLAVPLFLLLGWLSLAAASRGPTLALFGALVVWFALAPDRRERRWGFAGLALFAIGTIALLLGPRSPLGVDLTYGRALSNYVRIRVIGLASEALATAGLFGIGTGGFAAVTHSANDRIYPHNLFVEIGLENGVVGLAVLVAFLLSVVLVARRVLAHAALPPIEAGSPDRARASLALPRFAIGFFVFSVLAAQTSGDILANEWIWLSAGLLLGLAPRPTR